jgi:hypothetical protein
MKTLLLSAALLAASLPALAQTNVSINIGQPGFYGRIDLGDFSRPPVVYANPVIIQRQPRQVAQPMYLRVPPGHMKKWSKHCAQYNACGQQVYFVRDDWYNNTYAPRYRQTHGAEHDNGKGHGYGNGNGNGNGHGKDKDKGHGKGRD